MPERDANQLDQTDIEPSDGRCVDCGRDMTTEEAIRSDACPDCDPPKAVKPERDANQPTKRDVRQWEKENRQMTRARQRRELRCFFSRPFGHAYVNRKCVNCGRDYPLNF